MASAAIDNSEDGKGLQEKEWGLLLKAQKSKETDTLPVTPERMQTSDTLILAH